MTEPQRVGVYDSSEDVPIPGGGDVRNPYPDFAKAREHTPVIKVADGWLQPDRPHDIWMTYGHDAVTEVLRDNTTFSSRNIAEAMGEVMGRTILEMDGEEHLRHRGLVAQAFRAKLLTRWETELIEPLVHELVDRFIERGHADLVRELTYHYPIRVIARILGLPDDEYTQFQRWAIAIIAHASDHQRGLDASRGLREYLTPVLAARRREPTDDLISALVQAEVDGHVLSDEEILPFLLLLLPAGGETTYRATGNLLFGLLTNPAQLDAVRADRALIPQAIEEALRWEPPLLILARTPNHDTTLAGTDFRAGDLVTVCMGAANRDPAFVPDPDRYDLFREHHQHLSFGSGPHMCLGMHLARMEMRVALGVLLDRLPGLRLDPDDQDDAHIHGMVFRSPTSLPVVWDT